MAILAEFPFLYHVRRSSCIGCRFTIYSLFMDIQNSFKDIHNSFLDIKNEFRISQIIIDIQNYFWISKNVF